MCAGDRFRGEGEHRPYARVAQQIDRVLFGLHHVFAAAPPDLVISGTNFGPNVANHSGTVGGAITALDYGIPAVAVSTDIDLSGRPEPTLRAIPLTARFTVRLVGHLAARARPGVLLPEGLGLNVNYPIVGDGSRPALGVRFTEQAHEPVFRPSYTPDGTGRWQMTTAIDVADPAPGTDLHALLADRVSITPVNADWNAGHSGRGAALLAGFRG